MVEQSRARLEARRADYVACFVLGSQFPFEHTTTLDKFVYEAELRTGTGAHYRYAQHLRHALQALGARYTLLREVIHLGTSEPE